MKVFGTASVATAMMTATLIAVPTPTLDPLSREQAKRAPHDGGPLVPSQRGLLAFLRSPSKVDLMPSPLAASVDEQPSVERQTTERERLVGDLRKWVLLSSDWDGEGAAAAEPKSLRAAERFTRLLSDDNLPEPMLHASGRAGLFWKAPGLYADLEFLGTDRIAYYIERNGEKHKGVVNFNAKELPPVLAAVLPA